MKTVSIKAFAVSVMLVICGFMTMSCSESLVNEEACVSTEVADISECLDQQSVEPDYSQLFSRLDQFNDSLFAAAGVTRSNDDSHEWFDADCIAAAAAYSSTWYVYPPSLRLSIIAVASAAASLGVAAANYQYNGEKPVFDDFLLAAKDTASVNAPMFGTVPIPSLYRESAIKIAISHNEVLTKLHNYSENRVGLSDNILYSSDHVEMFSTYYNCETLRDVYDLCSDVDEVSFQVIERFVSACSVVVQNFEINDVIESYSDIIEEEPSLSRNQRSCIYTAFAVYPYSRIYWTNRNTFAYGN